MQQSAVRTPLLRPSTSNHPDITRISKTNYGSAASNELNNFLLGISAKHDLFLASFIEDILIDHLEKKPRDPDAVKAIADLKRLKNQFTPVNLSHARHHNEPITAKEIDSAINNFNICVRAIKIALSADIFDEGAGFNLSELDEKLHKQLIDQITALQQDLHKDKVNPGCMVICFASMSAIIVVLWAFCAVVNILSYGINFTDSSYECFHCETETPCAPSRDQGIFYLSPTTLQVLLYISHISSLSAALSVAWLPTIRIDKLNFTDRLKHQTVERLIENNWQMTKRVLATAVLNRTLMGVITALITAYAVYRAFDLTHFLPISPSQFNIFINCTTAIPNPPLICDDADKLCAVNVDAAANRFIGQLGNGYLIFGLGTLSAIYTALVFAKYLIAKIHQLYNSCFEATIPSQAAHTVSRLGILAIADDLEARQTRAERAESINADPNSVKMVELPTRSMPKITRDEVAALNRMIRGNSARSF